jgi:hypothetical protein
MAGTKRKKPDPGKICIRFRKGDDISLDLIGKLVKRMPPLHWIVIYEYSTKKW